MSYKTDNAIILAAGMARRLAPLSDKTPKALLTVRGEVLIERQIRQLQAAGISEIVIVTGYMKERFDYLKEKYGVRIVENQEYKVRNNHSSIYAARNYLGNSFICSADNYFVNNPFESSVEDAYYAAVFAEGKTKEWCLGEDAQGYICDVAIGGEHAWYMLGHVFWNRAFSEKFLEILQREYALPQTADKLWEAVYREHLDELKLKIRRYGKNEIFEFDTLEELGEFDESYKNYQYTHQIYKDEGKSFEI